MSLRYCIALMLALAARSLSAQELTPLHYLIESNSLIERPEMFRTLQQGIEKEWGSLEKGARLGLLDEKMKTLRESILDRFENVGVALVPSDNNPSAIQISLGELSYSIPVTGLSFENAFIQASGNARSVIEQALRESATNATFGLENFNAQTLQAPFLSTLKDVIDTDLGKTNTTVAAAFTKIIQDILQRLILDALKRSNPLFNVSNPAAWSGVVGDGKLLTPEKITALIKDGIAKSRETVADALNRTENKIREIVNHFDTWLVAANAGLAITRGENSLAGGIHISYNHNENLQLGIYVKGDLDITQKTADPATPRQTVVGGQFRYAWDRFQLDFLLSGVKADDWGMEAGCGASYRVGDKALLGLALFAMAQELGTDTKRRYDWSVGMTLKGAAPTSPILIVGVSYHDSKPNPIVQITYPVNAQK